MGIGSAFGLPLARPAACCVARLSCIVGNLCLEPHHHHHGFCSARSTLADLLHTCADVVQGVGPATASAVIAAACNALGHQHPDQASSLQSCAVFMSDELLKESGCKKGDYTMKAYEHAVLWTAAQSAQLNADASVSEGDKPLTAQSIEQAVFTAAMLGIQLQIPASRPSCASQGPCLGGGKGRKRRAASPKPTKAAGADLPTPAAKKPR